MKKILKYLRIANIDILVYRITHEMVVRLEPIAFEIQETSDANGRKNFIITKEKKLVHRSVCFEKANVLKLIGQTGPVIGDCYTNPEFRGKGIYPFVLSHAAQKFLASGKQAVYIIVNRDNISSIRGIEKAGFKLNASIKTRRWLAFYFDTKIIRQ